ncbi:MAG TPA: thiamine pyrophosphate-dependent enzyme [Pseudonocardiaceae bacterium]|jgi:acetolactate synthase-1/2/3 large subunit|nr:thiamine pyrophosphate-dependent enzyme [Pseudonocardiaceae bacterium]
MPESSSTAASVVVDFLAGQGVRRFYTVPGESFLEILDAVEEHPDVTLVSCRHESGAAFMAEAEAKLTGVPAVAMATRAVGASNLAIGVHTAHQDSTPMILLLGQVETEFLGREAFQEVDLPHFYAEITKHAQTVHRADRAGEAIARAHRLATGGRPGPAMLAFPADVLAGACPPLPSRPTRIAKVRPSGDELREIDAILRTAKAPVLLVGRGAQREPEPVRALAEHYGLGVYTAFRRQDGFPNSHPNYLGHLTLNAAPELLAPLNAADVVLVLGSRLSEITSQSYSIPVPPLILHVDPDPAVPGATLPADWSVPAAAGAFAQSLLELDGPPVERDWSDAHSVHTGLSTIPETPADERIHPAEVVAAMRRHLPADTVFTNDAGNFSVFCHRYWSFDHPHSQLGPTSGAMGYAVPAAVGAQLAAPERRVVALVGDGGFLMTGQEIETAVRHGAPILVVVFANLLYGTIAAHQARRLGRTAGVDIGPVDVAGYARSLGAHAWEVRDPAELDAAFAEAARHSGVGVIAVHTDPDVLSPTATLSGLLGQAPGSFRL